jgi:hypothetical protein
MYNISIINRYYPPNPAVTGEDACKMAWHLINNIPDVNVTVSYIDASYQGGGSKIKPVANLSCINSFYRGKNKIARFIGNFFEGYRLVKDALKKADIIISLTDPPLMNYWAGRFCNNKNIPWAYWSFDLYPHAFASAGLVSNSNLIYSYFRKSIRKYIPDLLVSLGKEQAKFIQSELECNVAQIILPCGIHKESANRTKPEWWKDNEKVYFAYAGNMGEAHSPDFIVDLVQCLDPEKHKCVLALYGAKAEDVLNKVGENPSVEVVNKINRSDLFYVDVHLVSLLPLWTHICVPSKAVSAICAEGTILFSGSETSDTWHMFNRAGWIIDEIINKENRIKKIKSALEEISNLRILQEKKNNAIMLKQELFKMESDAYRSIIDWILKSRYDRDR